MANAVLACGLLAFLTAGAAADQLIVGASKDNTLYEDAEGDLSNGAGPGMFAGRDFQGVGLIKRALVEFDVSAIPTGSTVQSVEVRMYMSKTIDSARAATLHRCLREWGEGSSNAGPDGGRGGPAAPGDATWIFAFFSTTSWGSPGGDFLPDASASSLIEAEGPCAWTTTPALVADVQSWVDAPSTNHGWVLLGDEPWGPGTARRFDTREHVLATHRPALVVEFTPPCRPDFNRDGFLTGDDFDEFVGAFEAGDISADYNGDGFPNGDDFDEFNADFALGC